MNKSHGLLAAALLTVTLSGCSASARHDAPAEISKPGADITQQSQPTHRFVHDPVCRNISRCPR